MPEHVEIARNILKVDRFEIRYRVYGKRSEGSLPLV